MQSLVLKQFLAVKILSVSCRPSSHANLNDPGSRAAAATNMELFDQVTLCGGILETSRGKSFVRSIAILKKRLLYQ